MGFVTIKDQDGVEHTIHASQLQAPNQKIELTYACPECAKLRADLAAANRELAAWKDAVVEVLLECCDLEIDAPVLQERIECRATLLLAELLAQEGE